MKIYRVITKLLNSAQFLTFILIRMLLFGLIAKGSWPPVIPNSQSKIKLSLVKKPPSKSVNIDDDPINDSNFIKFTYVSARPSSNSKKVERSR